MVIIRAMNDKRVRLLVLVITFLCSLVAGSHEPNRKFADSFSGNGITWNHFEEIDDYTV